MKKIILIILGLGLIADFAFGAWDKTKPADTGVRKNAPSEIRANWEAIETGTTPALQITNAKVSDSAAITDIKLAQITTPSKVSGAALTSLSSIPAGAGLIPVTNIDTGTTSNKILKLNASAQIPAVDGSLLTGLTKSQVGLSNVENTTLSTWAGSSNITTLGTVTSLSATSLSVTNKNNANQVVFLDASGYVPDNSVDSSALRTATSEITCIGGGGDIRSIVTGGQYCHWPQTKMASTESRDWDIQIIGDSRFNSFAGWTSYATYVAINDTSENCSAIFLYHTASGIDYWIWFLINKTTKDMCGISSSPDHPACGNGGDFQAIPHPFFNYNPAIHDIVLIEKDQANAIKDEAKIKGISVNDLIDKEYKIDFSRAYSYIPIHSGKFSPEEKPVLVENIPDYIQVRKLVLMSNEEKQSKETLRLLRQAEYKTKKQEEQNKIKALKEKLNLTDEQFELLKTLK